MSVLWTSFRTKEFPPEEYKKYYQLKQDETKKSSFASLLREIPETMWRLAIVQFFSWFALFLMWVYTTPGVAQNVWNTVAGDSTSAGYYEAGNWVGVIFAVYSLFGALFSTIMAKLANKFGRKTIYMLSLLAGGAGLISMTLIQNQYGLIFSMVGIGIAWAAILAMPYAILSAALPSDKMGVYMGIFNATITIPQIAAGLLGGLVLTLVGGKAILMLGIAGLSMVIAGITVIFVKEHIVTSKS